MTITFYPVHAPVQNWLRETGTCQLRSHINFWYRARGLCRLVDELDRGQAPRQIVLSTLTRFNTANQTRLTLDNIRTRTLEDGLMDVGGHNIWLFGSDVVRGWERLVDHDTPTDEKLMFEKFDGIDLIIEEGTWDVLGTGYDIDGYLVYQSPFRAFRAPLQDGLADGLNPGRRDERSGPAPVLPERIEALYRRNTHHTTESFHDFVPSQL